MKPLLVLLSKTLLYFERLLEAMWFWSITAILNQKKKIIGRGWLLKTGTRLSW